MSDYRLDQPLPPRPENRKPSLFEALESNSKAVDEWPTWLKKLMGVKT